MCDFPALELLTRRRRVVETMELYTAYPIIKSIDESRWNHFERTGCDCWEKARETLRHPCEALDMKRRSTDEVMQ